MSGLSRSTAAICRPCLHRDTIPRGSPYASGPLTRPSVHTASLCRLRVPTSGCAKPREVYGSVIFLGTASLACRPFRRGIEQDGIIPEPADDTESLVAHWGEEGALGKERIRHDNVRHSPELLPSADEIAGISVHKAPVHVVQGSGVWSLDGAQGHAFAVVNIYDSDAHDLQPAPVLTHTAGPEIPCPRGFFPDLGI